jgi:hypothetical protein
MQKKDIKSVHGYGTGYVARIHDTELEEFRVQMDGGGYVFITFNYSGNGPNEIRREEARLRASLAHDLVTQTLRAIQRGEL